MRHLEVEVLDTAELLATEAYGAGALLRWESCATVDGSYVEGGTEALVSGTVLYDVWDAAGVAGTFYRTRVSDAGGSSFSEYSDPLPPATDGVGLTVAQLRQFVTSSLEDASLQILLNAAEAAIAEVAGATGEITEHVSAWDGLYHRITVARPIAAITSVTEYVGGAETILATTDYRASGYVLTRLGYGTNPRWYWAPHIVVTYTPADDTAERQRVQRELVMLDLNWKPGLTQQLVEGFAEQYATTYEQSRADILGTLSASGGGMVVVGE